MYGAIYLTMDSMTEELEARIIRFLEQGPVTPDEVAAKLGVAWATAQGYLLKLAGAGKILASRKGRVNIYQLRSPQRVVLKVPGWAKVRSLEELSVELEAHFPANVSAAEMIGKERKRA